MPVTALAASKAQARGIAGRAGGAPSHLRQCPYVMVAGVMVSIVERAGWSLVFLGLGTGGCYFQVPEATTPGLLVLEPASRRVMADVEPTGEVEIDDGDDHDGDDHDEHAVVSLTRQATPPAPPPSRGRPARASRERSGADWARQGRLEVDEQIRGHFPDWEGTWCPLVLSFDEQPVRLEPDPSVPFATGGPVACAATDWPTAATPWLVRDLDASGAIEGGHELFGTGTRLPNGTLATGGFAALAVLDADGDGSIGPSDDSWSSLALWRDHDRDRKAQPGELQSLADARVRAIVLAHAHAPQCDPRGNCMIERSTFAWVDDAGERRSGAVIDVHLACRRAPPNRG